MRKGTEIEFTEPSLMLFIGPADCGKTYAATSFGFKSSEFGGEDPRPTYLIEMDGRINALRNRPIYFDTFTNEEGAIGVLNRTIELRETCIKRGSAPFNTLIFDSLSSFLEMSMADSLEVTKMKNKKGEDKGRVRGELFMPTVEDYGYESEAIRQLLWENLIDIKKYCTVIITAHEVEKYKTVRTKPGEPTRTELDGYKILARDKIAAKLPTKFDEIYHFGSKELIISQKSIRRTVVFQDGLARTSYPSLARKVGVHDITDKEFYPWWKNLLEENG